MPPENMPDKASARMSYAKWKTRICQHIYIYIQYIPDKMPMECDLVGITHNLYIGQKRRVYANLNIFVWLTASSKTLDAMADSLMIT